MDFNLHTLTVNQEKWNIPLFYRDGHVYIKPIFRQTVTNWNSIISP